jgi:hypothetical protein
MKRSEAREFREKIAQQYKDIANEQSLLAAKSKAKTNKEDNAKSRLHALYAFNARQKLLQLGV